MAASTVTTFTLGKAQSAPQNGQFVPDRFPSKHFLSPCTQLMSNFLSPSSSCNRPRTLLGLLAVLLDVVGLKPDALGQG